ncbi:MAG: hypothetical protein J6J83_03530 [Oscillospiraceae bacterium]|nr:hypothetical protein [Oscillospiraceae bacterium]
MKRSNLTAALCYLLVGGVCLALGVLTETKLDGILFGLAGAGICPGVLMLGQCIYRRTPEHAQQYAEKQAQERIEQKDELKEMLRGKAARYLYGLQVKVVALSMLVFSVLGSLELVEGSRTVVLYLGGFLALQLIAGVVIFNRLLRKYTGE